MQTHMCRFGMSSHIDEKGGDRGLVKKPTGFLTSARHVAAQLDVQCKQNHDHVNLMGGRAAEAQIYPKELCDAIVRGVVRQKKADNGRLLSVPRMDQEQIKEFAVALGRSSVGLVHDEGGIGMPAGGWPDHWIDPIHEEPGGKDKFGLRPQEGVDILKAHMYALTYKQGIASAKDDVSGK